MLDTKYLYTTQTIYKNYKQVGYTELFAPKVYGGVFLGIIVNGTLVSGRKEKGEFVSDDYQCFHIHTPTAEALAFSRLYSRYGKKTEHDNPLVIYETKQYKEPREACIGENSLDTTRTPRLVVKRGNVCPSQFILKRHLKNLTHTDMQHVRE